MRAGWPSVLKNSAFILYSGVDTDRCLFLVGPSTATGDRSWPDRIARLFDV
jgi:hypothetical protein